MAWTTTTDVSAGSVLTATNYNQQVLGNLDHIYETRQLAYFQQASTGTANTVLSGTMNELFASDVSFTADGTSTYIVEVYLPLLQSATNAGAYVVPHLTNGSGAAVGNALGYSPQADGTRAGLGSLFVRTRYTPAAGTRTLNVGGLHAVAAGTFGSSAATQLAHIAVYGPALT